MRKIKVFLLNFKKTITLKKHKFVMIMLIGIPLIILASNLLFNSYVDKKPLTESVDTDIENLNDTTIEEITTLLMDFELPEEGQIKDEGKRDEVLGERNNKEDFIVYENGYTINKYTKKVNSITYFDGEKPLKPQGTQYLAHFKALALSELPGYQKIGLSPDEGIMYITKEAREIMEEIMKTYDPNDQNNYWYSIVMDINLKIEYIERVEEGLTEYPVLNDWVQEAKVHLVKAKELGIENWEESYMEYIKASEMFDELYKSLHESYDYFSAPPTKEI